MQGTKSANLLIILSIYIALKPIYLWSSGSLQISDIFMLLSLVFVMIHQRGKIIVDSESYRLLKLILFIVLYQAIINGIWSIIIGNNLNKATLYYLFNMLAVLLTILIIKNFSFEVVSKYIIVGCFISLCITNIGLFLRIGGIRRLGFFNNPNQLGYYALIIFSICLLYFSYTKMFFKVSIIVMSIWAIIASGSKAAFIGAVLLFLLHLLFGDSRKNKTVNKLVVQILLLIIITALLYLLFFGNNNFLVSNKTLMFVRKRILSMSTETDSSLGASRGYDRIFELGINFIWGMGEGYYYRFTTLSGLEAHSSYVTLIVSYGLFGFLGYIALIWKFTSYKPCFRKNLIVLSGVLLYGVTHNGLRNTLLWILLTLMFSQRWEHKKERETDNVSFISNRIL